MNIKRADIKNPSIKQKELLENKENVLLNFTVEEVNLICIYAGESRNEVIEDIERALPYLDDTDMVELSNRIIEKLRNMKDEEFERLELIEAE